MANFADGNLSVAWGLKKTERSQAATPCGNSLPNFLRIAARRSHDAQAGDDWETFSHWRVCELR